MDPAGYVPPPAHQQLEPVGPRLRDLDRVLQPFSGLEVVDHLGAVRVADDIYIDVSAVLPALVPRRQVVVSHTFATLVKVFGLNLPQHRAPNLRYEYVVVQTVRLNGIYRREIP